MSTRIEPRSTSPFQTTNPLHRDETPVTINNKLPHEILLSISQLLGMKECLSARLTCHHWKEIVDHPTTIYCQYKQEIEAVKKLLLLKPKSSDLEAMLLPFALEKNELRLKLSSCSSDIIVLSACFSDQLYPQFSLVSEFFSFSSPISLSDPCGFLAKCGNTYFFNTVFSPEENPDQDYKLVMKNFQDPSQDKEVLLFRDPDAIFPEIPEYCFPISEIKVVTVDANGEVSFWDLSKEPPFCYQTLQIEARSDVYKIGNYLVLNNKIIDLITQSVREHAFTFQDEDVKIYGSALCTYSEKRGEIRYFSISSFGLLNKQWDLKDISLFKHLKSSNGISHTPLYVQEIDEQYIVLACWQCRTLTLFILNSNGEIVHTICHELIEKIFIPNEQLSDAFDKYIRNKYCEQLPFTHIYGNILIYKLPQFQTLVFLHIPTKKEIQTFLRKQKSAFIKDARLHDGKLTLLLSSEERISCDEYNRFVKFRIIQSDPQFTSLQK
jgi:hypothetical protein